MGSPVFFSKIEQISGNKMHFSCILPSYMETCLESFTSLKEDQKLLLQTTFTLLIEGLANKNFNNSPLLNEVLVENRLPECHFSFEIANLFVDSIELLEWIESEVPSNYFDEVESDEIKEKFSVLLNFRSEKWLENLEISFEGESYLGIDGEYWQYYQEPLYKISYNKSNKNTINLKINDNYGKLKYHWDLFEKNEFIIKSEALRYLWVFANDQFKYFANDSFLNSNFSDSIYRTFGSFSEEIVDKYIEKVKVIDRNGFLMLQLEITLKREEILNGLNENIENLGSNCLH